MGIDFGSTRCVLAVSRNKKIEVIPLDNSSGGDLWTESVISYSEKQPVIGKAAIRKLKTKPDYVIFDYKLLFNGYWRSQLTGYRGELWPFKVSVKMDGEPYFRAKTTDGTNIFSASDINAKFLGIMKEAAYSYQSNHVKGTLNKAVITVPQYFYNEGKT